MILVCAAVTALMALCIRFLLSAPSIVDDAVGAERAVDNGDAGSVIDYLNPRELAALGWTEEHAQRFVSEVLLPKYSGIVVVRSGPTVSREHGMKAVAEVTYRMPDGRTLDEATLVSMTDDGGKTLLSVQLQRAWIVQFFKDRPNDLEGNWRLRAVKSGILADYEQLKRWKFSGFVSQQAGGAFRSLDSAFERAKQFRQAESLGP